MASTVGGSPLDPQKWVSERWTKHSDSVSITQQFSEKSSWQHLSPSASGLNIEAMRSLAAALANEGKPQCLDATRLAWRMAIEASDMRSLALISASLSQLGQSSHFSQQFQHCRQRCFEFAEALCGASRWALGQHLVRGVWARTVRNQGDYAGFLNVASALDSARVLREVLSGEATASQRFSIVQTLALYELNRGHGASRLDWMLGLLAEIGSDVEAGSTVMRVLLVDTELALEQQNFNLAYVGALRLSHHMATANTELCSRADLANLLRSLPSRFGLSKSDPMFLAGAAANMSVLPCLTCDIKQVQSLLRDLDRMNEALPQSLTIKLPLLSPKTDTGSIPSPGVILPFSKD